MIRLLPAFLALASIVTAIEIKPATSLSGGQLKVDYSDAGSAAAITLIVFAGGDTVETAGQVGTPGIVKTVAASGSVNIPLTAAQGPSDKNAYFIQAVVNSAAGGSSTDYSNRFSISGMTGEFPAAAGSTPQEVEAAYKKVANDPEAVPDSSQAVAPPVAGGGAAPEGDVQAYSMQTTGAIKYAPMQKKPGTKITASNTKPLYPTTAFKIATTNQPIPSFQKTVTVSRTEIVKSRENTGAPQADSTDDMQKFLNRWKD